jgi:hypothetical protein
LKRQAKKLVGGFNIREGRKTFNEATALRASEAEHRRLSGLSMQWLGKAQRAESKALKFPESSKRRIKLEEISSAFKSAHNSMYNIVMAYNTALARAKTDEQRLELAQNFAQKRQALEAALSALLKAAKKPVGK